MHLFSIVTLYWSAAAIITLSFQYVNHWLPDPLYQNDITGPMAFALSSLLIIFPLYIGSTWLLEKGYRLDPLKRQMRLRKWLLYFTLFATALIMSGDLVSIVFSYVQGELTSRFALKALAVLVVAAAIFGYYLWDIHKNAAAIGKKYFAWAAIGLVTVGVIGGFIVVGSPQQQRAYRFDEQRLSELQSIQYEMINYWQKKGELPTSLTMLNNDISGYRVPVDPQTGTAYEYTVTGKLNFALCASFNQPSRSVTTSAAITKPLPAGDYYNENWQHSAGRVCFDRTIDPELYPVKN